MTDPLLAALAQHGVTAVTIQGNHVAATVNGIAVGLTVVPSLAASTPEAIAQSVIAAAECKRM